MISNFKKHINSEFPYLKNRKLLIAISGGIDSAVLTSLLKTLNFDIALAHCNFNLRGKESDLDETFIKQLAVDLNIPVHTKHFDTKSYADKHKVSIQMAARELRYEWFHKLSFDFILTAHHLDDTLETFLINLTRGTGIDGLTGIPKKNENIIRPLLPFSRKQIEQYAEQNNITWREDISNASTKYDRNKIRHQVVPILKELNPSLLSGFSKTLSYLHDAQELIASATAIVKKEVITDHGELKELSISKIKELPNPKAYLFELLKSYNFREWNDIKNLLNAQSGKLVRSNTHQLLKDRDVLILSKISKENSDSFFTIHDSKGLFTPSLELTFTKTQPTDNTTYIAVDTSTLKFPLTLRKWKHGDFFYPTGMHGKKKVSKYFKDEKFSLIDKENTWLLCNNDEAIIWIAQHRADKRFTTNSSDLFICFKSK